MSRELLEISYLREEIFILQVLQLKLCWALIRGKINKIKKIIYIKLINFSSLKCYISSDDDADSAILGDTMQVLDALMASHHHPPPTTTPTRHHPPPPPPPPPPALHLLYECCQQHHKRFGCGVTTLICLAGYWATEILPLTQLVMLISPFPPRYTPL